MQTHPHQRRHHQHRHSHGIGSELATYAHPLAVLVSGDDEVEINVKSVSLEDLRTQPFRATVEYEKIYYSPSDRTETRRERYIGNFVFTIRDHVPNSFIPVNPLGLTITYFREDQAFQ